MFCSSHHSTHEDDFLCNGGGGDANPLPNRMSASRDNRRAYYQQFWPWRATAEIRNKPRTPCLEDPSSTRTKPARCSQQTHHRPSDNVPTPYSLWNQCLAFLGHTTSPLVRWKKDRQRVARPCSLAGGSVAILRSPDMMI